MGLINEQDRRPRDWAYIARFDKKDLPSLEEMARYIRETHDTDMIEDFNRKCEQKLLGESATLDNGLEIKTVTKSKPEDLVLNAGLRHCINIILGLISTRWSHFGMGVTSTTPVVTDTALITETVSMRVPFAWAEPVGMRLLFGAISNQSDPIAPQVVAEMGVYNSSAAGAILLNRSAFLSNKPQQESALFGPVYTAPIIVSAVIEFCPVA